MEASRSVRQNTQYQKFNFEPRFAMMPRRKSAKHASEEFNKSRNASRQWVSLKRTRIKVRSIICAKASALINQFRSWSLTHPDQLLLLMVILPDQVLQWGTKALYGAFILFRVCICGWSSESRTTKVNPSWGLPPRERNFYSGLPSAASVSSVSLKSKH